MASLSWLQLRLLSLPHWSAHAEIFPISGDELPKQSEVSFLHEHSQLLPRRAGLSAPHPFTHATTTLTFPKPASIDNCFRECPCDASTYVLSGLRIEIHSNETSDIILHQSGMKLPTAPTSMSLAAQCEIPPHIAQYPFEIVSQRGVSHPFASFLQGIAEVSLRYPFSGGGIAPPLCMLSKGETLRKGGGGYRTQLAMLRHPQPHSAQ